MGEVDKREVVKVNLGWAQGTAAILAIALTVGGSWVAVKTQIATLVADQKTYASISRLAYEKAEENQRDIDVLKIKDVELERATSNYRESLEGLRKVLGELNVTLGRMDERMKNIEERGH